MVKQLNVGDIVDYHSFVGGEITSRDHKIYAIGTLPSGQKVAWITGKIRCVHILAITKKEGSKDV